MIAFSGPGWAQDLSDDFRGPLDEERAVRLEEPASLEGRTVRSPVYVLRETISDPVAETGSTGLGAVGRVVPVRPFSDRVDAVSRVQSGVGVLPTGDVFGGDTEFDQADGIRLGTFTILPELAIATGWTDNTSQTAGGSSGALYRISPNVSATSNWARHELSFGLRGSYIAYPGERDDNDPSITASSALRLDLNSNTTVNASADYTYSREDASSAENAGSSDDIHQISGALGITRNAGLVAVTLRGGLDRNVYTADGSGGASSGRDNTLLSANLRLDTNSGAMLAPFAETSLLLRRYDRSCSDALCEKRDANGYQLRGGLVISSGSKVSGEIAAGWRVEDLEDARLETLSGLVVDGSLVWSPSRLTTITAGVGTSFEATDIDGASGSIIYSADLRAAHAFSDRLVGEAGLGYSYRTYQGASIDEATVTGLMGLTYAVTRNVAFQTQYRYRNFDGAGSGSDYDQNSIEAGIRIRH